MPSNEPGSQSAAYALGNDQRDELAAALTATIRGEVRFDRLHRSIYSSDASVYEITPRGVVLPIDADDVAATVTTCARMNCPIVPRGAGTGLAGGAVGSGVQIDLSRHMRRIGPLSPDGRSIEVEAGVVLDELNRHVAPLGLMFAPDVATSSRATIGGMIANNSCGANSIRYGRTVDHVCGMTVVLSGGEVVRWGDGPPEARALQDNERARHIEDGLARIRDVHHKEIVRRFPRVLRSNGGYGLDRLGSPGTNADPIQVLCGSEGTLGVVVSAGLRLTPRPRRTGLVLLHFDGVLDALATTPDVLHHNPAAVELVDRLVLDAGRLHPEIRRDCAFLDGDPSALLIVEFYGDEGSALTGRMEQLARDPAVNRVAGAAVALHDEKQQAAVWRLRSSGLGLLMSRPGDAQPYAFVEDSAVDPARLAEYIRRFAEILKHEGVTAGYYAHASVGCIHVRPVLNLKQDADVRRMYRIAAAVCDLAMEFGGTMTGEHGDGLLRSCWLERMYGPPIIAAFREVKELFDPANLMNPGKIVDPMPMTEHLRQGPTLRVLPVPSHYDGGVPGDLATRAGACTGVGRCRQKRVGTMCPSYDATGEEMHTTRSRANALRIALSNRGLLSGLDDPALEEVMDLCIGCRACKTECPIGVDMARMKTDYLAYAILRTGASARSRFIADTPARLAAAARFPRLSNLIAQSSPARNWIDKRFHLDRRIPPPRLAPLSFRKWFRRHLRRRKRAQQRPSRGRVVYFVDTWTDFCTPQVGMAAVRMLEWLGYEVDCPPTVCCGRPMISQGLLEEAKQQARTNIRVLEIAAADCVPIIGTEPSCLLTMMDDYPALVPTSAARQVASRAVMIETFLRRVLTHDARALPRRSRRRVLYHAHCHQKALVGTEDAMAVLRWFAGDGAVDEINSGCCGMAGAFGHEKEHYDVARAIGEQRLFPAIREHPDSEIAISGFSCREQIAHHTPAGPKHVVEYMAECVERLDVGGTHTLLHRS